MKTEHRSESQATENTTGGVAISGRRKLIRGGVIGAPIILALKSTSVWACHCKNPSGFSVSGNFSQTHSNVCADPAPKPSQIGSGETLRLKKFAGSISDGDAGMTLPSGVTSTTYTLGDALGASGDAQVVAAAYINAARSRFGGVTKETVRVMWNNTANSGSYAPSAGVTWKRADVINYLKYVMAL